MPSRCEIGIMQRNGFCYSNHALDCHFQILGLDTFEFMFIHYFRLRFLEIKRRQSLDKESLKITPRTIRPTPARIR